MTFEKLYRSGPLPASIITYNIGRVFDREPKDGGMLIAPSSTRIWLSGSFHDCTSEYDAWRGASQRCNNPKNWGWKDYGGRGILFRFASFYQFIEHIGLKPSPELSLDRINNDGHYEAGNVRWATSQQQVDNRRKHGGKA